MVVVAVVGADVVDAKSWAEEVETTGSEGALDTSGSEGASATGTESSTETGRAVDKLLSALDKLWSAVDQLDNAQVIPGER